MGPSVSADKQGTVIVWEAGTGRVVAGGIARFRGPVGFSADGAIVWARPTAIHSHDLRTGTGLRAFQTGSPYRVAQSTPADVERIWPAGLNLGQATGRPGQRSERRPASRVSALAAGTAVLYVQKRPRAATGPRTEGFGPGDFRSPGPMHPLLPGQDGPVRH